MSIWLGLALSLPPPAAALRSETVEGAGLEELGRTLRDPVVSAGPPIPSSAGLEEPTQEKRWHDQIVFHATVASTEHRLEDVSMALDAIDTLIVARSQAIGSRVAIPQPALDLLLARFDAEPDPTVKAEALYSLVGHGFGDPEVRQRFINALVLGHAQPGLAKAAVDGYQLRIAWWAAEEREMEEVSAHLFSLLAGDVDQELINAILSLLGIPFARLTGSSGEWLLPSIAGSTRIGWRKLVSTEPWLERLRALQRHENRQIAERATAAINHIQGDQRGVLMADRQVVDRLLMAPAKTILSNEDMRQLAMAIQVSPRPRALLQEFLREGRRVLFVACVSNNEPVVMPKLFRDAMELHELAGLTHVALPLPTDHQAQFDRFLAGEDDPDFLRVLDGAMGWHYGWGEVEVDEEEPKKFLDAKEAFRTAVRQLQTQGVIVTLFGAPLHVAGELALHVEVQLLYELVTKSLASKVLVYKSSDHLFARVNLTTAGKSVARELADRLRRMGATKDLVASILEQTEDNWHFMFNPPNNLSEFVEHYPGSVTTSFGMAIPGTPLAPLRFSEELHETFEMAWDGLIFRPTDDEEDHEPPDRPVAPGLEVVPPPFEIPAPTPARTVVTAGLAELLAHAQSGRVVILGPSATEAVAGLDEVVRTLQASGLEEQVITLPAEATSDTLDAIVARLRTARDQVGTLVVTTYGDARDPALAWLRERLAQARIPTLVGALGPLQALVRQLFLNLGVPATVATPEAVQQWLAVIGLEEAA